MLFVAAACVYDQKAGRVLIAQRHKEKAAGQRGVTSASVLFMLGASCQDSLRLPVSPAQLHCVEQQML